MSLSKWVRKIPQHAQQDPKTAGGPHVMALSLWTCPYSAYDDSIASDRLQNDIRTQVRNPTKCSLTGCVWRLSRSVRRVCPAVCPAIKLTYAAPPKKTSLTTKPENIFRTSVVTVAEEAVFVPCQRYVTNEMLLVSHAGTPDTNQYPVTRRHNDHTLQT